MAQAQDAGPKKTYPNHADIITADTDKLLASGYIKKDINIIGIDIDLRTGRGFHLMPVWHVYKPETLLEPRKELMVVGKMIKIATTGDSSEKRKYYAERLLFAGNLLAEDFMRYTLNTKGSTLSAYIDENK